MENKIQNNKIEDLIKELRENRKALKDMIDDLEQLKSKLDKLFPDKLDSRYKFIFEERLKVISSFFASILNIRQEINKSISTEATLLTKFDDHDEEDLLEDKIRELANRIEQKISIPKVGGEQAWKRRLKNINNQK